MLDAIGKRLGSFLAACLMWGAGSAVLAQPLAQEFARTHSKARPTEASCPDLEADSGVKEIALERTTCYGTCPAYTLILRSDGSAEYDGRKFSARTGCFVGRLAPGDFDALARFAFAIGFLTFDDEYSCVVTDNPGVFIAVSSSDWRKLVYHYAPSHRTAPATLDVFEDLIDRVGNGVKWKKAK